MTKTDSIKKIFSQSNKMMLLIAILPILFSIFFYTRYIFIYQNSIENIQSANEISTKVKNKVLEEMWDVVFGQIKPSSYTQKGITVELRADINRISENANTATEKSTLDVALRTLDTMEKYLEKILENVTLEKPVQENEVIMEQIDSVNQLLYDILQDFVHVEIDIAGKRSAEITRSILLLTFAELVIIASIFFFSRRTQKFIEKKIQQPIDDLVKLATEFSNGHLDYRSNVSPLSELSNLSISMNTMADNLNTLIGENAEKQHHLAQSEVRTLQAQITPHFIYNSLDAILALVDQGELQTVKEMTFALSDFFRISLSKGKDWIPLSKEIRHVEDYLKILKIRYGKMLSYTISVPQIEDYIVLKMILQPIIENAVYHGTKFIRDVGTVQLEVKEDSEALSFYITDNGIGMTPERLQEVRNNLNNESPSTFESGYGLYNVHRRLKLYYGEAAKLKIDSVYNQGTRVLISVPKNNKILPKMEELRNV
ncbi:ATP-binding protein [Enterococcus sp. JM4C]|uniref:sensor histidine kinase n=1 Tax=Candidatus Enterococcus huntleyi TaxID=1857217 RepID=UPI0013798D96|nr:sensor histidine kinase [Enterococcus sp. JM4C]KAF1296188.1 ATP-binding protein [Enterococcus sp. JM4C]